MAQQKRVILWIVSGGVLLVVVVSGATYPLTRTPASVQTTAPPIAITQPTTPAIPEPASMSPTTTASQGSSKISAPIPAQYASSAVVAQSNDQDTSEVDVSVDTNASFMITDKAGQHTGRDPRTGDRLEEIPSSTYFEDRTGDEVNHSAQIEHPSQGEYLIVVTGIREGTYELAIRVFSRNGSAEAPLSAKGKINVGSQARFVLAFGPSQNSTLTIVSDNSGQAGP